MDARQWPIREECLLTVRTLLLCLLKVNTYLLQRHFKKVHIRNCSFIYKKVKMKGGLGSVVIKLNL